MRNPPWSRDELVIALHFYLRHAPSIPSKKSTEIAELSGVLNRLKAKLGGEVSTTYRNANSVYMKLMNLRRFDPSYEGKGLQRGNRDERAVWDRFFLSRSELERVTGAIRALVASDYPIPSSAVLIAGEEEAEEGELLIRAHRDRERNTRLVRLKKDRALGEAGELQCEACSFDFSTAYGNHGRSFIECHHVTPLSELKPGQKTKLADLRLVCSNCHRMIHRKRPWLFVEQLRKIVASQRRLVEMPGE